MAKPKPTPPASRNAIFAHQLAIAQNQNRRAARKAELMRGYRSNATTTTKENHA